MGFISDMPTWVIGAIIGGIAGAIFGLIGWSLTRRGLGWGKYLPIVAIAATISLANNGLADWVKGLAMTQADTGEELIAAYPTFFTFVRDTFPNDFDQLTAELNGLIKSDASNADVEARSSAAVAEIRRRYAPMVGLASDAEHAAIVDSLIEFYSALLVGGTELCNSVAISGPGALSGRPDALDYLAMVEPQAVMSLQAAANAMKSPVQRREVTDEDWAGIIDGMSARGATEAQLNAISSIDPNSPDLCPALLLMLQTINELETEGSKAVRAQYVADLAAA